MSGQGPTDFNDLHVSEGILAVKGQILNALSVAQRSFNRGIEQNEISGAFTTPSINLYVRLEKDNECQGVESIALIVNAAPSFTFPEEHYVCTDGEYLDLVAPSGYDSYEWKITGSIFGGLTG